MVGGTLIEIAPARLDTGRTVLRLWVIDPTYLDEMVVYAEPFDHDDGPDVGETIWWQGDRIYYDSDRLFLKKVGKRRPFRTNHLAVRAQLRSQRIALHGLPRGPKSFRLS